MIREILREQQGKMAHSCWKGEKKTKKRSSWRHRRCRGEATGGGHTHTQPPQMGSIAHPKGQHLRSGQPCRDKAGGADTGSHLSTAGTDTALWSQMLPSAEPVASRWRSGGRWNWCFDELPPSTARSTAGSHPPAAPSRCWLPNQGVLFFG